jgi:uncharacterized protein (UPF0335 family)
MGSFWRLETGGMSIDYIKLANTKAKGKRPAYMDDPAVDRLLSIVMALAGELAVTRERLDTVERLLDEKAVLPRDAIEAYAPDRDTGYERGLMQREYIARILRGVEQDMQAIAEIDPPLEDVTRQLKDM